MGLCVSLRAALPSSTAQQMYCRHVLAVEVTCLSCAQVLHGTDVIADGTLKKYDAETQLSKEHTPLRANQEYAKPPKEQTGVDFSKVSVCPVTASTAELVVCLQQAS